MSHSYPSDISREQFVRILPTSARRRTKPRTVDLYDVFSGSVPLKSGCQWRMLPADFPNWRVFPAMERAAWPGSGFHSGAYRLARGNGRKEQTSFCIVDSQSVKRTPWAQGL